MKEETCGECLEFFGISKRSKHGWCLAKSILPFDGFNGFIPPKAKTVKNQKDLAKPFIVEKETIIEDCQFRKTTI